MRAELSNAQGGRPTKNERREQAREQARQLREEAKKRERRNRVLLQSGIIVAVIAIALVITLVIINNVRPAGPGPANMASGGVLYVSDGNGGIKVQPTAGLPDGADPVPSQPTAQVHIQEFIDLACPVCQQFEIGLDYDGDGHVSQDELDQYNERNGTNVTDDPSTLDDFVGNLDYIETLVKQGVASLELFPVAIVDRSYTGSKFASRAANAAACIVANDPEDFLEFTKLMYQQQPQEGSAGMDDAQILSIAEQAGAGSDVIQQCIKDQSYKNWVAAMTSRATSWGYDFEASAKEYSETNGQGLFGTPTVIVNGQYYAPTGGYPSNSSFKSFILQIAGDTDATPSPTPSATPTPTP